MENEIVQRLIKNKETISSMESCTAGYFATTITNVDGSSEVLKFSAITYSNDYKIKMGVKEETISKYSVYSFETSNEMAKCISDYTLSTYGVGITGKINRFDKNNPSENDNLVFVTIYNRKNDEYIKFNVMCPNKSRKECKEFIVNMILKRLLEIIWYIAM